MGSFGSASQISFATEPKGHSAKCAVGDTFVVSSPERVKDGTPGHQSDFALLHPFEDRRKLFPIPIALLEVVDNTSFAFVDLAQDETRIAVGAELRSIGFESSGALDTL